jgi:hypothetical protein
MGMLEEGGYDLPAWEGKDGIKGKSKRLIQMAITLKLLGCYKFKISISAIAWPFSKVRTAARNLYFELSEDTPNIGIPP